MNTWTTRLRERMKALQLTQEALADKLDVTRGAVTHYLAERREPPLKQLKKLAQILKCDPAWLQFGVTSKEPASTKDKQDKEKTTATSTGVPIIHWHEVAGFSTPEKAINNKTEFAPYSCHQKNKSRLFALRVKGDAMIAATGREKSFHESDLLIVNPDADPKHGDYVIVVLPGAKEATFKQYVIDGGVKYLKPLNLQYPMTPINKNARICGVVAASLSLLVQ
jgi:SOS-response transcriptional repressor LexA